MLKAIRSLNGISDQGDHVLVIENGVRVMEDAESEEYCFVKYPGDDKRQVFITDLLASLVIRHSEMEAVKTGRSAKKEYEHVSKHLHLKYGFDID